MVYLAGKKSIIKVFYVSSQILVETVSFPGNGLETGISFFWLRILS